MILLLFVLLLLCLLGDWDEIAAITGIIITILIIVFTIYESGL